MGRHSSFNKQQVLADALDLFWSQGFSASSLKHLEEVTDMHPGSLYYHFNNKEQLYIATLRHYQEWFLRPRIDKYLIYGASTDSLRRFFTAGYRNGEDYQFRNCCFAVSSSSDLHLLPESATTLVRDSLNELHRGFLIYLEKHVMASEPLALSPHLGHISCELLNLYLSVQLRVRIAPNQHKLDKQIKLSLDRILTTGAG